MRVPLIVSWPGKVKAGAINHDVVSTVDHYPTLLELTGQALRPDPLVRAIQSSLRRRGLVPFTAYVLPRAFLRLNQGIGRLVRREDDKGVVVIADDRILQSYMAPFLRDLVCQRSRDGSLSRSMLDIKPFLLGEPLAQPSWENLWD